MRLNYGWILNGLFFCVELRQDDFLLAGPDSDVALQHGPGWADRRYLPIGKVGLDHNESQKRRDCRRIDPLLAPAQPADRMQHPTGGSSATAQVAPQMCGIPVEG